MLAPALMMMARDAKGATPPEAPSSVSASQTSDTSALVSWKDESVREDEFAILRRVNGSGAFTEHATVDANVEEYEDTGLTTSDTYEYKVEARNEAGASGAAGPASVTLAPDVPAAPSGLSATPQDDHTTMLLQWTDNATEEDEYRIYVDNSRVATIGANSTSHTVTGLTEATSYDFQVAAANVSGEARSSTVTQATKLAQPTSVTKQELVTSGPVRLMWTDESGAEQNYEVFRNSSLIATVAANTEQYDDSDSPDIDATYEVRAIHSSLPDSGKVTAT